MFKKSSFCTASGCIEVEVKKHQVTVRDGAYLRFQVCYEPQEWEEFIKGVKAGEFDLPK